MAKIPFTLEAWLKDKSQRVETRDGRLVHNIWRVKEPSYTNNRKAEVCALIDGEEDALVFFEGGRYLPTAKDTDNPFDLFIVTPEEELTDFENAFGQAMMEVPEPEEKEEWYPFLKEKAAELLSLAREQLIKDGYVIEKKAFHDAVEKVDPEVMKEVSENIDLENFISSLGERFPEVSFAKLTRIAKAAFAFGKAEALKDLPRWKKCTWPTPKIGAHVDSHGNIVYCCRYINITELTEKLPGFKEG